MLITNLSAVSGEAFSIAPDVTAEAVTLKLQGSCDTQALSALDQFLGQLHAEMVRAGGGKLVRIDCERLYFMNSSSLKCFVTWLTKIKALPKPNRYTVHIVTNDRLPWQRRSFGTIHRTAPEIVTLSSESQTA